MSQSRRDAIAWAVVLLGGACLVGIGALLAAGCSDGPRPLALYPHPGAQAPTTAHVTTTGVVVLVPSWADAGETDEALRAATDTVPEADPRIASSARGLPAGWTLGVLAPGAYFAPYSPTGLAAGETRQADRLVYAAWRHPRRSPEHPLPALAHELRHAYTRDPSAGH